MKKCFSSLFALVLCICMVCPVWASSFVPSISYKPGPSIVTKPGDDDRELIGEIVDENGNPVSKEYTDCIIITPVGDAETSDRISEENKDTLLKVYDELKNGDVKLSDIFPEGKDYVIKDLFDLTGVCDDIKENLPKPGYTIDLTFDIGVDADVPVKVMVYLNGEWVVLDNVINNGDGTITCTFEDFCPVAIMVPANTVKTGDESGVMMWAIVALVSFVAMLGMVVVYRRKVVK